MTEELTPPVIPEQVPTEGFVNTDGTFIDGWQSRLADETLREDKTLATIKDIDGWAKNHVYLRKQVPMDKIPRPNEHSTDEDWDEFHKAGGRPDFAADFNIKRNEQIPEEMMTKDVIDGYQNLFHKIGLSKTQVEAITKHNEDLTLAAMQSNTQQQEMTATALKDGLTKKWGMAFDQKAHLGNIAIEKGAKGDLDYKQRLLDKINNDPDLIEFASNMGSLFSEHNIVEDANIPTPSDMDTQIQEATAHPAYMDGKHPLHKRQVQLVSQLTEAKLKSKKVG